MAQETILVVEDEKDILSLIAYNLEKEGYRTIQVQTGESALAMVRQRRPDLVVLDLMLPGVNGFDVCRQLKSDETLRSIPILMLTAKSEDSDIVSGLEMGADDYLTKPFSPRELVARIKAALRRYGRNDNHDMLTFRQLKIDPAARQVWQDDELVDLTALEFDLLHTLARHPGRVLSREQILEQVWGHDFYGESRVVDVHLGHIRKKIEADPANPTLIVTVRGVGYRFEGEPG